MHGYGFKIACLCAIFKRFLDHEKAMLSLQNWVGDIYAPQIVSLDVDLPAYVNEGLSTDEFNCK